MKKLYRNCFVCLFVCFSINLQAKEVNKQMAEKVAINAFAQLDNNKNASDFQVKEILTVKSEEETSFYIVNFKPTGFIILSASDAAVPILGSSTESNFSFENLPPQLSYLFDCYKTQIKEIEKQKIAPTKEIKQKWDQYAEASGITSNSLKSTTTLPTQVNHLLPTAWNQNDGWNRFCPYDASSPQGYGNHVPTGCTATAMAQILKYWGCKVYESGTYSYVHPVYDTLKVDFNVANYQWNLMGNSPSDQYNAQLIRDCGVAVSMDYGPNGSGAPIDNAQGAFVYYFGFKNTTIYANKDNYTDSEWKDALKLDLSLGRPILYGGNSYGADTTAHAWVIDGYDSSDNFGCNWGYGSDANNGYFALTNLKPDATHNYYRGNAAILKLEPVMSNCGVGINGGSSICSSGTSFNVPGSSLPSGATVTWNKSDNITIVSAQPANPCTFQASGTGPGWIEATVHYNGSATLHRKEVWVGLTASISGSSSIITGGTGNWTSDITCGAPPLNYEWYLREDYGSGLTLVGEESTLSLQSVPRLSKASVSGLVSTVPGPLQPITYTWYYLRLQVTNANNEYFLTPEYPVLAYGNVDLVYRGLLKVAGVESVPAIQINISPNPASNEATLEIISTNGSVTEANTEWQVEVYDAMQLLKVKAQKLKGNQYNIHTAGWKEGVYMVRVKFGEEFITGKLVVKP